MSSCVYERTHAHTIVYIIIIIIIKYYTVYAQRRRTGIRYKDTRRMTSMVTLMTDAADMVAPYLLHSPAVSVPSAAATAAKCCVYTVSLCLVYYT